MVVFVGAHVVIVGVVVLMQESLTSNLNLRNTFESMKRGVHPRP